MPDQFEQQLSERLHAHPLPDELPDLGLRSVRRGQAIRRRRLAALAFAVVVLLLMPAGILSWLRLSGGEAPSVGPPTAPPSTDSRLVILDPDVLPAGAAPSLGVVRDRAVQLPSGRFIELPTDQSGSVAEYRSDVVWMSGTDREAGVSLPSIRVPVSGGQKNGVEPGPAGSVMVRTPDGPVLITADEVVVRPTEKQLRTDRVVAGANSLWVDYDQRVVQIDVTDLRGSSFTITDHSSWRTVIFADPRADLVTVESGDARRACHTVLRGSTADVVWSTCDWTLRAFSPDARFAVGQNKQTGSLDVIDLIAGRVVLTIDQAHPSYAVAGPPPPDQLVFDDQGRLNLVVPRADGALVGVICPDSGDCWRSTEPSTGTLEFVLPNRD